MDRSRALTLRWPLVLVLAAGCGDDLRPAPDAEVIPDADPNAPDAACGSRVVAYETAPGGHVANCSAIAYATNPPTSGNHYPTWAKFQAYDAPVPRGFYVHDLEHGAIVVTYHCPDGCDADVAALVDYLASRPRDPLCTGAAPNRFVVTPDPELDVRFAASAWGYALTSSCFDLAALGAFIDAHYGEAPEDFCTEGVDVLSPPVCP